MGEILDLDDHRPHDTSEAECAECGHRWQAVFPEDTQWLECPACGGAAPASPPKDDGYA